MAIPFVPIPNCARFELIYSIAAQRVENCFHIHRKTTAWTATSLNTMCGRLVTWFGSSLGVRMSDTASLVLVIGTDFTSKTSPRVEYAAGLPLLGSETGTPLPNNVTVAVSWHTALRGRSYRGRTYHIGMTDTMTVGSKLDGAWNALLAAAYNGLMTAVNDTDHELVIASRYNEGAWRATGVTTPIISVSIDENLDSQRRRLVGRGQ